MTTQSTGIASVDIYKMDADGKAIEHWDTLQIAGNPKNSAPVIAEHSARQTLDVAAQCPCTV